MAKIKNSSKILAIIPARGGSKGIPYKNIKPLAGKPLLAYTIESAQQSKLIDKLVLSSEDDKIINIAKKLGVEVPFKRPAHLSKDKSGSIEVVQHAIKFYKTKKQFFDAVLLLQPTCPFRKPCIIDRAIKKFIKSDADALVSVIPVPHKFNPHWLFELKDNSPYLKIATGEQNIIKRRQDLPTTYYRDGSIYITKIEVINNGSLYGEKLAYLINDNSYNINIDTEEDWKRAEIFAKSFENNEKI